MYSITSMKFLNFNVVHICFSNMYLYLCTSDLVTLTILHFITFYTIENLESHKKKNLNHLIKPRITLSIH